MSWWIWVLMVLGGLVLLLVAVVILNPFWYHFKDRRSMKKYRRELDKMTPAEREAQSQMDEYRRSERAMGMAVSADPTLSMMGFADLVSSGDIEGLRQTFSYAQSWETREMVVVAFMNLFRDRPDIIEAKGTIVKSALNDIIELSKAETSGGTYRQNCIDQAGSLADRIGNPG